MQAITIDTDLMMEVDSSEALHYVAAHAIDLCHNAHLPKRKNNAILSHLTLTLYHQTRHCFWIRSDTDHGSLLLLCKRATMLALESMPPYQDGQRV